MALTVGELNAIMSVDDQAMDPGLRRAEQALRQTGERMGDDAERAGQQAGEGLGEGLVRGADGRLRNARGQFVAAGRRAGDAVGDGLADGAADGADEAVQQTESRLDRLKIAGAAAGVAAGAILMEGFAQAMEQSRITGRLGAQLGATGPEAKRYGHIAGRMYADAVTEDFQGAADAISVTMRSGLVPAGATDAQIQSLSTKVSDLASTFELDLGQAANAAGQMIKSGLVKDGGEALDVLTAGLQRMGPRADDIADTFNEYSTQFRQMGLSAVDVTGIMTQGLAAGARDTDVVADSLKEFVLIAQGGGKDVDAAFKKIGLSGKEMQTAFSEGGPKSKKALDQVFDALRKVKDPADRSALALTLFGTKAEDMQKALFAIDPSKAATSLGKVAGAADKAGNTLRDNAGTKLEAFKRGFQQGLVEFLGGKVVPALTKFVGFLRDHQGELKMFAAVITAAVVPALVLLGSKALWAGIQMARAWIMALGPVAWIGLAIGALVILVIAYWDEIKAATLVAWDWIVAKIKWAKDMVLVAVDYLKTIPGKVSAWFESAKNWAVAKMTALVGWLKGLPGRVYAAMGAMASLLVARASSAFQSFRDAAVKKAIAFVTWVTGLPRRIVSGIGAVNSLLAEKGRNIVQGLWSGIQGMTGWISSKLLGWAKSAIPGPIARALGIASPSKVTKQQGRWIARGLVDGLTGSTKQIKAASGKLSDIIADSLAPGKKRSKALGTLSAGTKRLLKLAAAEEKLAVRLKAAQKNLASLKAARDKLSADVKKGILDGANITSQSGAEGSSAESILDGLRTSTRRAQEFAASLAKLRKAGVRSDLIAQIAQAGVDQGSAAAAALAKASPAQVKAINSQQAALVKAAGQAGTTAGDAMYGAGIQAAAGLVRGLQSQQKAIDSQMTKIAKSMAAAIKKQLGIRSPSRVMALLGRYTAQGLVKGVDAERSAVTASMASLVDTPAPGEWVVGAGVRGTGARAQGARVYTLRSDGSAHADYLVSELRKKIGHLGGDVQFVLGQGRR